MAHEGKEINVLKKMFKNLKKNHCQLPFGSLIVVGVGME